MFRLHIFYLLEPFCALLALLSTCKLCKRTATTVQQVISGGAAGSWGLTNLAPRALAGDFAPGFLVRHLVKDIRLAREEAAATGRAFPGLAVAERLYEALEAAGSGDEGTQVLLRSYDR